MARTAERVESLIDEDPEMRDALQTVLDRAEGGRVTWEAVSDDLTTGQWSRLIQERVLEKTGDGGCKVNDPGDVAAVVGGASAASVTDGGTTTGASSASSTSSDVDIDDEDSSWSVYDKMAAVGALGLFAGYSLPNVRNAIASVLDIGLGPLEAALPFYAVILVLSLFTGLYSTILQDNLMDTSKMAKYQERLQEIQEREKEARERDDEEELDRIQEEKMEAMGDNLGMFKEQFRPMVWIMLFTIPVFLWMYWMIREHPGELGTMVIPLVGEREWTAGVAGPIQVWIVWYFLCSMGFTQVIRKTFNIQTTPDTS
ncbi:DUF106 domain-containing protein [Haloglomus halophilum]|uniref:DUF106 domain-containing protein n=1 Tax=Haloglomus halophilum TaxID=2962672 RepID=UPI0020C99136|nr:DUF106 domain-containing protein [Haloglomus halophilum]